MPNSAHRAIRRLMVVGMTGLCWMGRHRIVAAGMERVAARQSPDGQSAAAQAAMPAHRLERVLRTGRIEAAARSEQRTDRELIGPDQGKDQLAHVAASLIQSLSSAARRQGLSAASTPARAPITMSRAGRFS